MDHGMRLLGVAPEPGSSALARAMGEGVRVLPLGEVAALLQPADPPARALLLKRDRAGLLRNLAALQKRLEIGCQAGAFLACDPGAATCPEVELLGLLEVAQEELAMALQRCGRRQQWDVILRWPPETVVAARRAEIALGAEGGGRAELAAAVSAALRREVAERAAALHATLAHHVLAVAEAAPTQGEAECGATVLVPWQGEGVIETALAALPESASRDASCDLRGPLPAIAFAALRIARTEPGAVAAAWALLELPERVELGELTQRWRRLAAELHPDRNGPRADARALAEAGAAYRLLRQEAARHAAGPLERRAMLARAGRHLALPAEAA